MLVRNIIQDKRRNRGCNPRDVIDVLLHDASNQLTDDLISDNIIDLMIPGEDSVPMLMTLAIKYLSDCPLALQHLEVNYILAPLKFFPYSKKTSANIRIKGFRVYIHCDMRSYSSVQFAMESFYIIIYDTSLYTISVVT